MTISKMIEGLQIFLKYGDDLVEAGHDEIWGPTADTKISEEDKKKLDELGWYLSDEYSCWTAYV